MNDSRKPVAVDRPGALIQIIRTLRLIWRLLNDSRISLLPKLIIPAAIVYILSPIDLLPDFVLGLGQLDDLGILLLSTSLFVEFCPKNIVEEHRRAIEQNVRASTDEAMDGTYRVIPDDEQK
jgi:uncharacterized membrane protein YkvA (DUF1232 family)